MKLWHKIVEVFAGWRTCRRDRRNIVRWRKVASKGPPELYNCLKNEWGHAVHFDGKAIETISLDPEGCFFKCHGHLTPMLRPGDEVLKMGGDGSGPHSVILRFVEVCPKDDLRDMFDGIVCAIGYWDEKKDSRRRRSRK